MDERLAELRRQMLEIDCEKGFALCLEWILAQRHEVKLTFFLKWTEAESVDPVFFKKLTFKAASAWATRCFTRPDTSKMEAHFEAVFMKNYDQPSDRAALTYMAQIKAPYKMRGLFIKAAVRAKRRIYTRLYMRRMRRSERAIKQKSVSTVDFFHTADTVPTGADVGDVVKRGPRLSPPHGKDIWDQASDYKVRIEHKARPEDFERVLAPYREQLHAGKATELVEGLLKLLYENADCPSVMGKSYDLEYQKLKRYPDARLYDALGKVSLYDHTLHVLEHAVAAIAHDERGHLAWFVPAIVSAALGHDIGKIPALSERKKKGKADHAAIAIAELKNMIPVAINAEIRKYIETAVYFHHTNIVDKSPAQVVMEADAEARVQEVCEAFPVYAAGRRIDEWLDPGRFAEAISPRINESTRVNAWKAMSFNGIVYCIPDLARMVIKRLGAEANILDWRLVREINPKDTQGVLTELADLLRAKGALAWRIEHPYFGSSFIFHARIADMSERKYYCMPLDETFFPGPRDVRESRKRGYLNLVFDVRPARTMT
jgi:hypothetical protein